MRIHTFWTIIIIALLSCGHEVQQEQNSADQLIDPKEDLNIQVSSFTEIDSSGILMFPLSMGESNRSGGSLTYKEVPNYSYWNIIFYNTKTNENHLLSDKKMLIRSYDINIEDNENRIHQLNHIFYKITSLDFNSDKLLNEKDPEYLYISDKQGYNFRQISPELYTVINWQFIKYSNKVVMNVRKDSDGKNGFDENDEITTFSIDIENDSLPKQVFTDKFKTDLKVLYDRDWKRLKNDPFP